MENERRIDSAAKFDKLKWVVFGIIAFYFLTLFMPLVQYVFSNDDEVIKLYWYTIASSSSATMIGLLGNESMSFNLLVPILATVFLFMKSERNKKILFFTAASLFILKTIFFLVSVSNFYSKDSYSGYNCSMAYGYFVMWMAIVAFTVVAIYLFIVHIKSKKEDKQKSIIDIMKQRLALLDSMKASGILTEEEYDAKRAELIHELKL